MSGPKTKKEIPWGGTLNLQNFVFPPISPPERSTFFGWSGQVAFASNVIEKREMQRSLYFIEEMDTQRIKIGVSSDTKMRLRQMQTSTSSELRVLAEISLPEAHRVERKLHEALAEHRIRGEWFSSEVRWLPEIISRIADTETSDEKS